MTEKFVAFVPYLQLSRMTQRPGKNKGKLVRFNRLKHIQAGVFLYYQIYLKTVFEPFDRLVKNIN